MDINKEGILSEEEINKLLGKLDNPWGRAEVIKENTRKKTEVSYIRKSAHDVMSAVYSRKGIDVAKLDNCLLPIKKSVWDISDILIEQELRKVILCRSVGCVNEETINDVYEAINVIVSIKRRTENRGLVGLEEALSEPELSRQPLAGYLNELLQLVGDGNPPDSLKDIAIQMVYANDIKGIDALIAYIYLKGALIIQAGESVYRFIYEIRYAIPLKWHKQFDEYTGQYLYKEVEEKEKL